MGSISYPKALIKTFLLLWILICKHIYVLWFGILAYQFKEDITDCIYNVLFQLLIFL